MTWKDLHKFSKDNGFSGGMCTAKIGYKTIADNLSPDEKLIIAFPGTLKGEGACACVATNRFVYIAIAQNRLFETNGIQMIRIDSINNLYVSKKLLSDILMIETLTQSTIVLLEKKYAPAINAAIKNVLHDYVGKTAFSGSNQISVSDELVKLAKLKEAGILSEEEFESQKSKLLR